MFCFIVCSCVEKTPHKNKEHLKDAIIKPLSPYTYEFEGQNKTWNRIDYFYLKGEVSYSEDFYKQVQKAIEMHVSPFDKEYDFFSIYVYKETDELNASYDKPRVYFDGKTKDLLAYVRLNPKQIDLFYILNNGIVIYDLIKKSPRNFEFDE